MDGVVSDVGVGAGAVSDVGAGADENSRDLLIAKVVDVVASIDPNTETIPKCPPNATDYDLPPMHYVGRLNNVTSDHSIRHMHMTNDFAGETNDILTLTEDDNPPPTPVDPTLLRHFQKLQRKLKRAKRPEATYRARRKLGVPSDLPMYQEKTPTPPPSPCLDPSKDEDDEDQHSGPLHPLDRLNYTLLSAKPLILKGIKNWETKYKSSAHKINILVEGLESPDEDGFRLESHQRDGVGRWEHLMSKYNAAILADEMGLGKTVTIIAVVLRAIQEDPSRVFLIAVPPGLLSTWQDEFLRAPTVLVTVYSKDTTEAEIRKSDVVLVSTGLLSLLYEQVSKRWLHSKAVQEGYGEQLLTLTAACKNLDASKTSKASSSEMVLCTDLADVPLLRVKYFQAIIDEGHSMRNIDTNISCIMRLLDAEGRGIMTGTPVQNTLKDFQSLLAFLRVKPFDNVALFNACFMHDRTILDDVGKQRLSKLNDVMIACIRSGLTIRRLKKQYFDGLVILPGICCIHCPIEVWLTPEEQAHQEKTRKIWDYDYPTSTDPNDSDGSGNDWASQEENEKQGRHLVEITKARMQVLHPRLTEAKYGGMTDEHKTLKSELQEDDHELATMELQHVEGSAGMSTLSIRRSKFRDRMRADQDTWMSSVMTATVTRITEIIQGKDDEANDMPIEEREFYLSKNKVVVFCESLAALDVLEIGLGTGIAFDDSTRSRPVQCYRYDGTRTQRQRDEVRYAFQELAQDGSTKDWKSPSAKSDATRVMLITARAGAEGITLTNASDVVFLGPSWNPEMEDECTARAARKGREDDVTIHRVMVRHSIHEKIEHRQAQKRRTARAVVDDNIISDFNKDVLSLDEKGWLTALGWHGAKRDMEKGKLVLPELESERMQGKMDI